MPRKDLTSAELAAALGVSAGRVRQLAGAGVLPRTSSGRYALTLCRAAYRKYKTAVTEAGDESTYLQYLKTSNDLMEAQNKIRRGELIPRDVYIFEIGKIIQACRSRLLALPSKAAPLLVGNDENGSLSILKRINSEARRELAVNIDFHKVALDTLRDKKRR